MTVSISHVHVLVDDPDAALAFYRDTLGLKVTNEVANEGFGWITLVTDNQPEITDRAVTATRRPLPRGWGRHRCLACQGSSRA